MSKIIISNFSSDTNFLTNLPDSEAQQVVGGIKIGGSRDVCKPRGSLGKMGYRMPHP